MKIYAGSRAILALTIIKKNGTWKSAAQVCSSNSSYKKRVSGYDIAWIIVTVQ